jgi:hypothetical protein
VSFGGSGAASLAARSDHYHPAPGSGLSTAIGQGTLGLNTGSQNVAVGDYAMATHTSGGDNVAIGMNSMRDNTTGSGNVAMGSGALYFSAGGSGNVAIGRQAMVAAIAHNSVAIGNEAMKNMSGTYNIGIGMWAGDWTVQGDNNIYIAHPGVQGSAGESNRIRIGFSAVHTHAFIAGIRGTTTGANDAVPVLIDSAGQLGTVSSSRRFKQDIAPLGDSSRAVQLLRPVQFRYSNPFGDGSKPVQFGLIAEEVAEIYPELVAHSADGQIETVKYHVLPTLLLAEVQRLERERAAMAQELAELKAMVARLLPNP